MTTTQTDRRAFYDAIYQGNPGAEALLKWALAMIDELNGGPIESGDSAEMYEKAKRMVHHDPASASATPTKSF